jgi:hypothetical protein
MSVNTNLDKVRTAAQALDGAMSDAAAKTGGAIKADIEDAEKKAKAVTESVKASIGAQNEATKKHLREAVTDLEAMHLKASGQAFQAAIRQTLADARASVQKVSEAVAAKRSAESTNARK